MKIRLALNSDFVSRKVRGAAYGILLLLTFFVPQFAKTQDQLNAVKTAQASKTPVLALEQKQVDMSFGKFVEAHEVITPISNAEPAAAQADLPEAEEMSVAVEPVPTVPVEAAFLVTPAVLSATDAPARETFGFLEPPVEEVTQTVAVVSTNAPTKIALSPQLTLVAADPVQVASLITPATLPAADATVQETAGFSVPPVEIMTEVSAVKQTTGLAVTQPVQVASLTMEILPVAQSATDSNVHFTGEYVTADFVNTPLVDFFRAMHEVSGVNIILDPAITGNVNLKVVKMPWDELFEAVLKNHGLEKKVEGTHVRVALKKTLKEEAKQEEDLRNASMMAGELEPRVKRLNYAKATELKKLLDDQKSPRGAVVVDERTNSVVMTDLPEYINKQLKLIDLLDIPQPQVEIETRIVSATRNFARDIGIQFGFVQGNNQRVTVGGSNTNYLQPNVNRPMGDTGTSNNSPGVSTGGSDTGGNLNINLPSRTPFGGVGIAIGNILDTFLLDAAITAGETKGWAKLISQPSVVVQNNSPAYINDGTRFPVAVTSDNTVTIQYYDAALTLTVTPQITYDDNIMLDMKSTNNKVDFGMVATGGIPTIRTSETSTRITVSDGGTTLAGRILVEDDGANEERVPGLGSLPLLGNLFRRTGTVRDSREILFFVTPRIVR